MIFSFILLNIRGLRNSTKHKSIFLFCKEQPRVNCFFLTRDALYCYDVNFWKPQCVAGVAILLNRLDGKVIDHKSDIEGH